VPNTFQGTHCQLAKLFGNVFLVFGDIQLALRWIMGIARWGQGGPGTLPIHE